jgi:3',5'-cyclic AMP phosphodiesterase CpdA
MTDIHVQPERDAPEGFRRAIETVNNLDPKPAFVITGGDLVMDVLGQSYGRADTLYRLYNEIAKDFDMPVYNVIGNHEVFGLYEKSGVDPSHSEYGKTMFKNRIGGGKTYRSFDHGSWHFVLLDAVGYTPDRQYIGEVDSVQLVWLKQDLAAVGPDRPVVLALHIPLYSVANQFAKGPQSALSPGLAVTNDNEVTEIYDGYNVALVLQGHLHIVEEIIFRGTHYITAGAVSGAWWRGPYHGFPEGFAVIDVKGDDFTWSYQTFGWETSTE